MSANKKDLLGALSATDLSLGLCLHTVKDRAWKIQACSATSGDGLAAGLEWLLRAIADRGAEVGDRAGECAGAGAVAISGTV